MWVGSLAHRVERVADAADPGSFGPVLEFEDLLLEGGIEVLEVGCGLEDDQGIRPVGHGEGIEYRDATGWISRGSGVTKCGELTLGGEA